MSTETSPDKSSYKVPPPPPKPITEVEINGVKVPVLTVKGSRKSSSVVTKESRMKMSDDELNSLSKDVITKVHAKYNFMPRSTDDAKQLEDYHAVSTLIKLTQAHLKRYDVHDVFDIVFPVDVDTLVLIRRGPNERYYTCDQTRARRTPFT